MENFVECNIAALSKELNYPLQSVWAQMKMFLDSDDKVTTISTNTNEKITELIAAEISKMGYRTLIFTSFITFLDTTSEQYVIGVFKGNGLLGGIL